MQGTKNIPARIAFSLGGIAFSLGALVTIGWIFRVSVLIRIFPQWSPMALYTAFFLCLSGLTLLLPAFISGIRLHRVRTVSAVALIFYCSIALLETFLRIDFGIEPHAMHQIFNPVVRWPGRLAPSTAFCFMLIGITFILLNYINRYRLSSVIRTLIAANLLISGSSLIGYITRIEFLYSWAGVTTMAAHTALGLLVLGAGVWFTLDGLRSDEYGPVARIIRTATALLVTVGVITGFTSFVLTQRQTERDIANEMALRADDRRQFFAAVIEHRTQRAATAGYLLGANDFIQELAQNIGNTSASTALSAIAGGLRRNGFSGVAFLNLHGEHRMLAGAITEQPELNVSLKSEYPTELLWSNGYILRTRVPVSGEQGIVGFFIGEQPLNILTSLASDFQRWGQTGDMTICASSGSELLCFPERFNRHPFRPAASSIEGQPLPVTRALSGTVGQVIALDFRGTRVLASYGPVGNTGLGLVVKMDTDELYAPIRRQFLLSVPLIVALTLIGLWLIRRNVQPLVKQLRDSGAAARTSEERFIAATENSPDAFSIIESVNDNRGEVIDFRYVYTNSKAANLMGTTKEVLLGQQVGVLVQAQWPPYLALYKRVLDTGEPFIGEMQVDMGQLEEAWLRIQAVKLGQSIAVTATDISASKCAAKAIQKISTLQRAILDGAGNAIIATTPNGTITLFNPAAERMLGYSAEEVIGRITPATFHDAGEVMQHAQVLSKEQGRNVEPGFEVFILKAMNAVSDANEWTYIRKDGVRLPVLLTVTALRDDHDEITGFLGMAIDTSERKRAEALLSETNLQLEGRIAEVLLLQERLVEQAIHDGLTGLYNRRYFDEALARELERGVREGYGVSLIVADLDHFKTLNDRFGHQGGDAMLRAWGELLRQNIRSTDIPCRYGGEEFAIVLPRCSLEQAAERAELLRSQLAALTVVPDEGGEGICTTVSMGVAHADPGARTPERLFHAADSAVYSAKRQGRNCVVKENQASCTGRL
jgi:diguanylate cyclase (GGDEF)-like protein/PAS domain S-box-containing protein